MNRSQRRANKRNSGGTDPAHLEMLQTGLQHHQAGQLQQAERIYRQVLDANPDEPDANYLLGMLFNLSGDNDAAVERVTRSIKERPKFPPAHNNLGTIYEEMDRMEDAAASYRRAVRLDPSMAEAHNNLGNALKALNDFDGAVQSFRKAIKIHPDMAEAHNNLGLAYAGLGQLDDAMTAFDKAIDLAPDAAEPYVGLGHAQHLLGYLDDAIANAERAIEQRADYVDAHIVLGAALYADGDLSDAVNALQKAVALDPQSAQATAELFKASSYACDWAHLEDLSQAIDRQNTDGLARGSGVGEQPLFNVTRVADPAQNHAIAQYWSGLHNPAGVKRRRGKASSEGRITIGYLSSDFGDHAVGHLTRGLFELHDRDRFIVRAYAAYGEDGSDNVEKVKRDADGFTNLLEISHADAASQIRRDKVDILVDLNGHTHGNRLQICAQRPAPVQVTWLGFPGTTGADYIDYILTDRVVTPTDHAVHYSEAIAYLPDCYQMNGLPDTDADRTFTRADVGLPDDAVVFCSFVGAQKIEPVVFESWMRILDATPGSILWLYESNEDAAASLKREAAARSIDADRVRFGGKLPRNDHLQRLRCADIALDTWTYGGHTTTSDALRADLPVIARRGSHFASRVSSSILQTMYLESLITDSAADYEALAIKLAQDADAVQDLKSRIAQARETAPLFDATRFVAGLEDAYRQMWECHLAGDSPQLIKATVTG